MFQRSESDVHRHHPDEQAHLFTSGDGCDAEAEYVDLLYSLVRVLKPKLILETGTYTAVGTHVMINALIANDQPAMIHTVDIDDFPAARPVIERSPKHVTRHLCSSLDFIHNNRYDYDFVFLDSDLKIRARELQALIYTGQLKSGKMFAIHDTSRLRVTPDFQPDPDTQILYKHLEDMRRLIQWLEFPLSRGMIVGRVL